MTFRRAKAIGSKAIVALVAGLTCGAGDLQARANVWVASPSATSLDAAQDTAVDPPPAKPAGERGAKSLDDDLLLDLPPVPSRAIRKKPPAPAATERRVPAVEPIDGEDVELGASSNPLERIGRRMRDVGKRINQKDTSVGTQLQQQEIVAELESLMKQMGQQSQKSGQAGAASPSPSKSAASGSQVNPRRAADSENRLDRGTPQSDGSLEIQRLVKEVWGQLPNRVREQISNISAEDFLPQYQRTIEEYYRRLSEDSAK